MMTHACAGRQPKKSGMRCDYGIELSEVVEIVAAHGFDEDLEGHAASFGMSELPRKSIGWERAEKGQIPCPDHREGAERGVGVEDWVVDGPSILIEGLNDVVRLGQGLAEADGEDDFGVGEMADDFAGVPLVGSGLAFDALPAQVVDYLREAAGGFVDGVEGVALSQKGRVWIHIWRC